MEDEILTLAEAAKFMKLSTRTLTRQTDLPRVKLSARRIGYRKSDLLNRNERRTEHAAPAAV